uniref:RdRp n=1 Tax=Plasmopara viticola lesion associated vivivirus 4 TaxID=2770123 RepID=A0A7H0RR07_9VIRU|nr:RdRp [Plasmopara viticola lesion associated vivivirus 4]
MTSRMEIPSDLRWDVGDRLGNYAALGLTHPAYRKVADMVSARADELARQEQEKLSRAKPAILAVSLPLESQDHVYGQYPEFRVVNYSLQKPGHAVYCASRALANQLLLSKAEKYASSVVHMGGATLWSLTTDLLVHNEMCHSVPAAVHARSEDMQLVFRLMGDYARVQQDTGIVGMYARYEQYMSQRSGICDGRSCAVVADAYLVDLSYYAMSPMQVVAGALQAGARMVQGFVPYHPVMLMSDSGEIPGTGVWFEKDCDNDLLHLKYPKGVCGASTWVLSEWASWLCEHSVDIGKGSSRAQYHLQLSKTRGPFMFFEMVRVPVPVDTVKLRHALELQFDEPSYVIKGWKLRSLAVDPSKKASWEQYMFMASKKVVDSIFAFGMQLKPEAFSRAAISMQVRRLDRVTIEGSTVVKGFTPSVDQLEMLTDVLHSELFAKRYEAGTLSSALMSQLKRVMGFSSASFSERMGAIATWSVMRAWDATVGAVVEGVYSFGTWLDDYFSPARVGMPTFEVAPQKLLLDSVVAGWKFADFGQFQRAVLSVAGKPPVRNLVTRGTLVLDVIPVSRHQAVTNPVQSRVISSIRTEIVETSTKPILSPDENQDLQDALFTSLAAVNELDQPATDRMNVELHQAIRLDLASMEVDQDLDEDFVGTMNEVYEEFNPGVSVQDLDQDLASIVYDDQDRQLQADKLKIPRLPEVVPRDREYFRSKLKALGAPKRQEVGPELLSAVAARNLAAPKISIPQDEKVIIPDIWEKFLDNMCIPEARDKLMAYMNDPVALEEGAYREWMAKADPKILKRVAQEIEESSRPILDGDVGEYLMMLKADVKPPLSDKPLRSRLEPQVIVYHSKYLSSVYSAIVRVLVRRFLSLLKPNVHVNLLKDLGDIRGFVQAAHPFGSSPAFIENDFSKYDKSQDAFAFKLERYVFTQLGMNQEFLERWMIGHEDCRLISFVTGLSLHVRFQRKSGDATTAFGNVIYNVLSVNYAYGLSDFFWVLFMGDDSLMCVAKAVMDERAVQVLAEIFNLSAKTYITDAPYFASTFFMFDNEFNEVFTVPDPIKRIEKWSQPVTAVDPQWKERWISATDTCKLYSYKRCTHDLAFRVAERYPISAGSAARLIPAVYTAISSEGRFRSMYEDDSVVFRY